MKLHFIIISLLVLSACNSGKKDGTTTTTDTVAKNEPETIPPVTVDQGKLDIETFGDIKLGHPASETIKVLGQPASKAAAIEWAADGLMHEDWSWPAKGLVLNMSSEKGKPETMTIYTITATAPCNFKTRAGMGIGSSYAEVEAAYKKDIDPEATGKTYITVGSVYGGIIFNFVNDKANKVFLGAEAE